MDFFPWFCSLLLISGSCNAFPYPFLWPSSFLGGGNVGTTTTTTTTTLTKGPPHPHAQNTPSLTTGSISPAIVGIPPQSSHLHIRPASGGSHLTSRPLPPLVGVHHHHQHRPVPSSHLHLHGGAIGNHRHQYHHHHHHSARLLHHHIHPAALHFPLHA